MKTLFIIFFLYTNLLISQKCEWGSIISERNVDPNKTSSVQNTDIVIDSYGNTYVIGNFNEQILYLNNGITIIKSNDYASGYIAKYNSGGLCQWASTVVKNNVSTTSFSNIAINNKDEIYLTGEAGSSKKLFDETLIPDDGSFIIKLNSNLEILKVDVIKGGDIDYISIDNQNNLFVAINKTGKGKVEFNNNFFINKSEYFSDILIAKYNSDGICQWVEVIRSNNADFARSIVADNKGDLLITGRFENNANLTFNNGIKLVRISGGQDCFIAKYDTYGNCLWAKAIGGNYDDATSRISIDNNDNIILTCNANSSTFKLSNSYNLTLSNSGGTFIAKFDQNGNVLWAKALSEGDTYDAIPIAIDKLDNIYVAASNSNLFNFDGNGNELWQLPNYSIRDMDVDNSFNFYITGSLKYNDTSDFNNGVVLKKESIREEGYIAKYSNLINTVSTANSKEHSVYPNPAFSYLTLSEDAILNHERYEIYDITGRIIQSELLPGYRIDISSLDLGTYYIRLFNSYGLFHTSRFVKINN